MLTLSVSLKALQYYIVLYFESKTFGSLDLKWSLDASTGTSFSVQLKSLFRDFSNLIYFNLFLIYLTFLCLELIQN